VIPDPNPTVLTYAEGHYLLRVTERSTPTHTEQHHLRFHERGGVTFTQSD
jgi:hypothetical protein